VRSVVDDQPTTFVAYSVDGKYVASSSNMGPVRLWDSATGEFARVFPGTRCTFSPDGRTIACTSVEPAGEKNLLAKVNLYDLASASPVKSLVSEKATATSWLLGIAFSPSGRLLAAANWDGTVTFWDVETGERKLTITDHSGGVHTAVFSPDGTMLATGSEDKTLRLRKLSTDLIRSTSQKK
jgi:WD40 repeat protein